MWIHDGSPHQSGNLQNSGITVQDSLLLSHQNHWNLKVPYTARWDLHESGIIGKALKKSSTAIDFWFSNFHFEYLKRLHRSEPLPTKMPLYAMFANCRGLYLLSVLLYLMWIKKLRPWQDSNLQSPDPKSGALSIRPQGLRTYAVRPY
jgi:hypothetical protein